MKQVSFRTVAEAASAVRKLSLFLDRESNGRMEGDPSLDREMHCLLTPREVHSLLLLIVDREIERKVHP